MTDLIKASSEGDIETISFLLDRGVDVNMKDYGGSTALMLASFGGHTETVSLLLDRGADVNMKNTGGHTALDIHSFIWRKHRNSIIAIRSRS